MFNFSCHITVEDDQIPNDATKPFCFRRTLTVHLPGGKQVRLITTVDPALAPLKAIGVIVQEIDPDGLVRSDESWPHREWEFLAMFFMGCITS